MNTQRTLKIERIYLVALVFTLYKIDRYAREGSPQKKITRGLTFVEETLDRLALTLSS